tara:strand:+ start:3498 stop:4310 length:813 start_codon:yes stop_codon:yes gene_type:complete
MRLDVGLIIIGDEILSGKRVDRHFLKSQKILGSRGLTIGRTYVIGDSPVELTRLFKYSFESEGAVFCFGGIGSTPDDFTRQSCASALNLSLKLNATAVDLIKKRYKLVNLQVTDQRLNMAKFPSGAGLIPNPVNGIPGFFIKEHYFLPGFPQMAWPMMEWILDQKYTQYFSKISEFDYFFKVEGLFESSFTPLLEKICESFPMFSVYSLPNSEAVGKINMEPSIELGLKCKFDLDKDEKKSRLFHSAVKELRTEILKLKGNIKEEGLLKR